MPKRKATKPRGRPRIIQDPVKISLLIPQTLDSWLLDHADQQDRWYSEVIRSILLEYKGKHESG
jgi:hemerythrin